MDYDKNVFAANLTRAIWREHLRPVEVAARIGVTRAAVSQWMAGQAMPRMDKIERLAAVLNTTKAALIDEHETAIETRRVPRVGTIACGEPILAEQNIEGYDDVPAFIRCDYTVVCKGDSMIGARIMDGDIVCVRATNVAEEGQICVVGIEGAGDEYEATLKRVRFIEGGVVLWPENPNYSPMVFTGRAVDTVHIQGVATHFISVVI